MSHKPIRFFPWTHDCDNLDECSALHDLADDCEDAIHSNDLWAIIRPADNPEFQDMKDRFLGALRKWFAEHPEEKGMT